MHCTKRGQTLGGLLILALLLLSSLSGASLAQPPQLEAAGYGYAFTYQGHLEDGGGPVNGTCDFRFGLWTAASGPAQVGSTLDVPGVTLAGGLFTARLNFGAAAHTGGARWLEIAVRCPAGSGTYATLTPRQELTAAPAALALALPFEAGGSASGPLLSFWNSTGAALELASQNDRGLYVSSAGSDGVYVDQAGSPSTTTPSADPNGFEVAGAEGHGLWVGRAGAMGAMIYRTGNDGVHVNLAGDDGIYVEKAGSPKTTTSSADKNGFEVASAQGHGLWVGQADGMGAMIYRTGNDGVHVYSAGGDGMKVEQAGNPGITFPSADQNGFEVAGAQGNGLWVGRANLDGVRIYSAGNDGVRVETAGGHGLYVEDAYFNGLQVDSAGTDGIQVSSAGDDGVEVSSASGHGLYVVDADLQGVQIDSATHDGVEVFSAGERGLHVVTAADDGVYVEQSYQNGVHVGHAYYGLKVDSVWNDGVRVAAEQHGVHVEWAWGNGVHVASANVDGAYANTNNAAHEWGFYTPDKIYAGTTLASGGPLLVVAQSGDGGNLEPGDLVAVSGVGTILPDAEAPVPLVRRSAADGSPVLGVVYHRLVVEEKVTEKIDGQGQVEQQTYSHTNSTDGPVAPGDYLFVVILGAAQVKIEATVAADLHPGDLLTTSPGGQATKATPVQVGEVTFYAPGTIWGQVMGAAENGLIWVWVNPR